MTSHFFIDRPIFASVLSIIIVLAGLAAAFQLPVEQYPQITPPTVIVTANYPGANAETLIKTVAAPIEEKLSAVEGLLYFNSSADSSGRLTITITFMSCSLVASGRRVRPSSSTTDDNGTDRHAIEKSFRIQVVARCRGRHDPRSTRRATIRSLRCNS